MEGGKTETAGLWWCVLAALTDLVLSEGSVFNDSIHVPLWTLGQLVLLVFLLFKLQRFTPSSSSLRGSTDKTQSSSAEEYLPSSASIMDRFQNLSFFFNPVSFCVTIPWVELSTGTVTFIWLNPDSSLVSLCDPEHSASQIELSSATRWGSAWFQHRGVSWKRERSPGCFQQRSCQASRKNTEQVYLGESVLSTDLISDFSSCSTLKWMDKWKLKIISVNLCTWILTEITSEMDGLMTGVMIAANKPAITYVCVRWSYSVLVNEVNCLPSDPVVFH